MYKKIDQKDIDYIRSVSEHVLVGDEISEDYSHDELAGVRSYPEVVVKVQSQDEIVNIMKYAYENNIPVVPGGSGTGLVGGAVAICGGILLITTLMNKIVELDEENLTVTVEPGVLLMELVAFVEGNGLFYPPDPGEKSATIGGNISTNAGGMRAVKYGVTKDYVRELTVVLATGEVITVGGKVVKNSSGYPLKDLFIGSEGTLGIITRAVLKLMPMPNRVVSLLVAFDDMETGIALVPEIIKSKAIPTAIEFMERETILFSEDYLGKKFPDTDSNAYILLTFDGDNIEQIESEYEGVANLCLKRGAKDVFIVDTDERRETVWGARGVFLEAIKASTVEMDECDVVVPRNKVAEFIMFSHELAKDMNIRIPSFGHAGDGNLHIYICRDELEEEEWKLKLNEAFDRLYAKSVELNGLPSGEHGIGYAKREYLRRQCGETQIRLMKGIKGVFDPKNILNPQKVI